MLLTVAEIAYLLSHSVQHGASQKLLIPDVKHCNKQYKFNQM